MRSHQIEYNHPMPNSPDQSYLDPYIQAADQHGSGFKATLWRNREMQIVRFDVFREMANFSKSIIVDAGCGEGDFASYLVDAKVPYENYIGIDGVATQIESATSRNLPRCEFYTGDFVADTDLIAKHSPDWVCFSGSLNTMDDATVKLLLAASFLAAKRGIIFNFLSNRPAARFSVEVLRPARRFDTIDMLDWSFKQSPRIRFRQDYLDGHDATIMLEHERR